MESANLLTPLIRMTETTFTLQPNRMYVWDKVTSLTLTLEHPVDSNVVNRYMFQFTSGNITTDLKEIAGVLWVDGFPSIQPNKIYQAYITNGIGVILCADVTNPLSAKQWVDSITVGWNLANSFESTGSYVYKSAIGTDKEATLYETLWGNPVTTRAMIDTIKAKGFNTIRIPVTWAHHLDDNFQISSYWMDRIEEVVNYVLDNDMKCIINTHHDHSNYNDGKSWLNCNPDTIETVSVNFAKVWTQISNRFKDYSSLLSFEAFNELMTSARTWKPATQEEYNALNQLGQTFVNTVRATGGNNLNRILCINTYGGGLSNLQYFKMPTDLKEGYLLVNVHMYETRTNQEIEDRLTLLDTYFGSKKIPVIISECATTIAMNYDVRILVAKNFVARALLHGYKCFVWDTKQDYQLLDRTNLTWKYDELANAYMEGLTSAPVTDIYRNSYIYNSISPFSYGALDEKTGLPITFALGGIYLTNRIQVVPEYQYIININSGDNGFRVTRLFWWDEKQNFIGCTYYDGVGVTLTTVKAPYNAKYFNFFVYNPWGTRTQSNYTTLLKNEELSISVKETVQKPGALQRFNLNQINLGDAKLWISGDFDATCARYRADIHKVSTVGLIECEGDREYKVHISNNNIALIIRELDNQGTLVYSHNYCSDGMYLPISQKTKYLVLVLYSLTDENSNYKYFQNEFTKGLTIALTKEVNPHLNKSGCFNIKSIDFKDISNYRTGNYHSSTGVFNNLWYVYHIMCISHLIEVSPSSSFTLTLSDGYALMVQELNSSKGFISNLGTLKNGGKFKTSSNTKYIALSFVFYDNASSKAVTTKVFKDFYSIFHNKDFNFTISNYIVYDDFNRADNTSSAGSAITGHTWSNSLTPTAIWGITNRKLHCVSNSSTTDVPILSIDDGFVAKKISVDVTLYNAGIVFRVASTTNFFLVSYQTNMIRLRKVINGNWINIMDKNVTLTEASTHKISITDTGAKISVYLDEVLLLTADDNALNTNTKAGVRLGWANFYTPMFDNYIVESL